MSSLKALTLAGAVAIAATQGARAADLLPPPPPPPPVVIQEFSGWYLRGDIGVGVSHQRPKWRTSPDPIAREALANGCYDNPNSNSRDCNQVTSSSYDFRTSRSTSPVFAGLGIGYQFNNWLRADVTGEYRGGSRMSGVDQLVRTSRYTQTFGNGGVNAEDTIRSTRNFYHGNVSSIVGLVNGYVDMGTYWGVTPYVGAGVGFARSRVDGLSDQGFTYVDKASTYTAPNGTVYPGTTAQQGFPTGGYFSDGKKTRFAWALMAGLAYNVNDRLKLELGYRYLSTGKLRTGRATCFNARGGEDACGFSLQSNRIDHHDIRLGMRWMLTADPAPVPVMEVPIVRKF